MATGLLVLALSAESARDVTTSVPGTDPVTTAAPASALVPTLALPRGVTDVELTGFPDWLANEPLPASFRSPVAIRGTTGLASLDGITVINWTESGTSYHLRSLHHTVSELIIIADALP